MTKMQGFTITELMIATAVFSIILLVGSAVFVNLGNTYYKGFTITQTQETGKQIMNDISNNIRLSSSVTPKAATGNQDQYYYCIGTHRYTFNQYKLINTASHDFTANFGLVEDNPGGCANPCPSSTCSFSSPVELLANNNRVVDLDITTAGDQNTYAVSLNLASGDDNSLTIDNSSSPATAQCNNQASINRFCAVTNLTSIVHQGAST